MEKQIKDYKFDDHVINETNFENIINKIVSLDRIAEEKMKEALSRCESTKSETDAEIEKIKQDYTKNSNEKLKKFEDAQKSEFEDLLAALEQQKEKEKIHSKKIFEKNRQKWEKEILKYILGNKYV